MGCLLLEILQESDSYLSQVIISWWAALIKYFGFTSSWELKKTKDKEN